MFPDFASQASHSSSAVLLATFTILPKTAMKKLKSKTKNITTNKMKKYISKSLEATLSFEGEPVPKVGRTGVRPLTFNLEKIVRKNILAFKPYSSARDDYKGNEGVFLDANENPFGELNRYPDPYQKTLKEKISSIKNIATENIFVGNGSDEVIDIAYRTFCEPGRDKALTFSPTYGMYDVSANINNVELIKIPLTADFQIDFNEVEKYLEDDTLKLIFICSPNNPTANNIKNIERIIEKFNIIEIFSIITIIIIMIIIKCCVDNNNNNDDRNGNNYSNRRNSFHCFIL